MHGVLLISFSSDNRYLMALLQRVNRSARSQSRSIHCENTDNYQSLRNNSLVSGKNITCGTDSAVTYYLANPILIHVELDIVAS